MNNQIIIFSLSLPAIILVAAIIHWLLLRRKCLYKHMLKSKSLKPVSENGISWYIKFSPGKVLWIFSCWVYWQKYYPSGKSKYIVSNGKVWILNKIREVQNIQNKTNI